MLQPIRIPGAATLVALLSACGGNSNDEINRAGEGSIVVALTNAPNDAACLRLTIDTSSNSGHLFALTPGTSTRSYRINRLPVGRAVVDGEAFPVACSALASFTDDPLDQLSVERASRWLGV
jgi:hypothetical protein